MIEPFDSLQLGAMSVLVAACFAAAVLNLAAESRFRGIVMSIAIVMAVVIGSVFYGSGYAFKLGLCPEALIRALLALCRMFAGVNDLNAISGSPLLMTKAGQAVFWLGHFCGFYVTASAAITTLGDKLLRRIRVTLLRKGPLLVIYGINSNSVTFGKHMSEDRHRSILFVDPDGNTAFESTIKSMGAVLEKSKYALAPGKRFLWEIKLDPGTRRLELAALHSDGSKNLKYATALLDALMEKGIHPQQISLIASGIGESSALLQVHDGKGYGSVLTFDDYELTARLVIRDNPPCSRITFDEHGKAMQDFHAVILGYGKMGRAMLAQIVCNAQFYGSGFTADVFDPGAQNGFLHEHELMRNYNIRFHNVDGKSDSFYSYLQENDGKISCIVLCTGSPDDNREIADDLEKWYRFGRKMPMIIQVAPGSYICMDENRNRTECSNIYESNMLDVDVIDAMAMQMNQIYSGNDKTAEENWEECGYFNRMSSRASADFFPAMLRAAHKTSDEVINGSWPPDPETLENLAITEHLRWCAFHHVNGFSVMPKDVFDERAKRYQEEVREKGQSSIRISKDMENHIHACLIPWEELDDLSERENRITGGNVDYKQMDRNNVLIIPDVISAMKNASGEKNAWILDL